jgi:hypothetical protein
MKRRAFLAAGVCATVAPLGLVAEGCAGETRMAADPRSAGRAKLPAPIAGQDYRLIFSDEFDGRLDIGETGHRWAPHIWWQQAMDERQYGTRDSCLYLRSLRDNGWGDCNLSTEWGDTRGGTFFRGGYFEARVNCAKGWNAFWLFSVNHSRSVPKTRADAWCSELDILETDAAQPTRLVGTLHRNTGGAKNGGPADQQNHNSNHEVGVTLLGEWHTYAALWTRSEIVWFVDEREVARCPTFESTWQEMFLILGLGKGGVNGGPAPPDGVDMIEMLVDWVRVWEKPRPA